MNRLLLLLACLASVPGQLKVAIGPVNPRTEVLTSVDALPPHITGTFRDPVGFGQSRAGQYYVFDRRAQAVYAVDRNRSQATRIVQVGPERGRLYEPTAFALEPDGTFVVVDGSGGRPRLQRFSERGALLNGFTLSVPSGPRLVVGGALLGGIGSVQYVGDSIIVSQPESGSLFTEYSWDGRLRRAFGTLRETGHETDRVVHLALNRGIPLVDPTGGFSFVFQSGVPTFRKYDADGRLVFERHIEGREIDGELRDQPRAWPTRQAAGGIEVPVVMPLVRTAAIDPKGNLWVALAATPILYVYAPDGEKIRTVQLRAAGPLAVASLFFAASQMLVAPGCYMFDVGLTQG
jgi:hypothetical protein